MVTTSNGGDAPLTPALLGLIDDLARVVARLRPLVAQAGPDKALAVAKLLVAADKAVLTLGRHADRLQQEGGRA